MVNPLLGPDHQIANWFHAHLTQSVVTFLRALSEPGSGQWIVLVVGFSRIALGAHYLSDVLAAIMFGVLWLSICLFAGKPTRRSAMLPANLPDVHTAVLLPATVKEAEVPAPIRLS